MRPTCDSSGCKAADAIATLGPVPLDAHIESGVGTLARQRAAAWRRRKAELVKAAQEAPPQQQAEQGGMLPTVVRFMFTYMLVSSATPLFRGGMHGPLPGGAPTAKRSATLSSV